MLITFGSLLFLRKKKICSTIFNIIIIINIIYLSLLFEGIGQVAVGIGKVGLKFNGSTVRVNGEVNEATLHTLQLTGSMAQVKRGGCPGFYYENKSFL